MPNNLKFRKHTHNWFRKPSFNRKRKAPSEWDEAARKSTDEYLLDLYSEEHLSHRATFSFLRLPREVRDDIYDYAWGCVTFGFLHRGIVVVVRYGQDPIPHRLTGYPRWLGISHQFRREALEQLYRCASFTLGEFFTLPIYNENVSTRDAWATVFNNRPVVIPAPIMDIRSGVLSLSQVSKIKILGLPAHYTIPSFVMHHRYCSTKAYPQSATYRARGVVSILSGFDQRTSCLADLELKLTMNDFFRYPIGCDGIDNVHWDFSILDALPRTLRYLKLVLLDHGCWHPGGELVCAEIRERVRSTCARRVRLLVESSARRGEKEGVQCKIATTKDEKSRQLWHCEARVV